ncbi:hypothetical protein CspHIS471_0101750 [Cutaneotrichosporon sp. HIS471]|nr:hypothetical protein CspHIS471_0101750 [Cutaneotrichosporon sp. HIS471]
MDVSKLKVVELRDELSQRGLDTRGLKKDLAERLTAAIEANGVETGDDEGEVQGDMQEEVDGIQGDGEGDGKDGKEDEDGDAAMTEEARDDPKDDPKDDPTEPVEPVDKETLPSEDATLDDATLDDATPDDSSNAQKEGMVVDQDAHDAQNSQGSKDVSMAVDATATTYPLPPSLTHLTSSYPPSKILYISNLRRPLLLSALHSYLTPTTLQNTPSLPFAHADYPGLWLSGVKDHAYAGYDSPETALEVAARVHGQVWPDRGAELEVQFVDPAQVEGLMEKEEVAWGSRQRLVLAVEREGDEWKFDVIPPTAEGRRSGLANVPPAVAHANSTATGADPVDRRGSQDPKPLANRLANPLTEKGMDKEKEKEDETLGRIRRTRAQPSLEFREGPGAPERKRRGNRGGRGRRRGRDQGDNYHPSGRERQHGAGDSYHPGPERREEWGRAREWGRAVDRADRYVPGGGRDRSPRRETQDRYGDRGTRRGDRWRP